MIPLIVRTGFDTATQKTEYALAVLDKTQAQQLLQAQLARLSDAEGLAFSEKFNGAPVDHEVALRQLALTRGPTLTEHVRDSAIIT